MGCLQEYGKNKQRKYKPKRVSCEGKRNEKEKVSCQLYARVKTMDNRIQREILPDGYIPEKLKLVLDQLNKEEKING